MHGPRWGVAIAVSLTAIAIATCGAPSTGGRVVAQATSPATPARPPTPAPTPIPTPAPTPIPTPAPTPVPTAVPTPRPTPRPAPVSTPSPDALPGHLQTSTLAGHIVLVYVPGAYAVQPATRYPVVYFLHGSPGSAESWLADGDMPARLDELIARGQLPPIIAVFPDDQGTVLDDSYWGNTAVGDTVESWFIGTLIPTIDGRYRTLGAAYRGIAGLSAGGFGALNLAIHNPGVFSWVASYSGVFMGPTRLFETLSDQNSPQLTVSTLPANERFPLYLGRGAEDTEFGPDTTQFVATVEGLGWAPLRTEVVPGAHEWSAWMVEATDSLIWLGQLWGRA
jgi:enterochelin esterase-like enzyme